jgi:hypothetical protein
MTTPAPYFGPLTCCEPPCHCGDTMSRERTRDAAYVSREHRSINSKMRAIWAGYHIRGLTSLQAKRQDQSEE